MSVGEELDLARLDLYQARKIAEERGKVVDGVCKGATVIIMNRIQADKDKVRMWYGRKIIGVEVLDLDIRSRKRRGGYHIVVC